MAKTSGGKGKPRAGKKKASGARTKAQRPRTELVQQPVGLIERTALALPKNYGKVLRELKDRIRSAQQQAALSVNRELIGLYIDIGRRLAAQEETAGWGDKVVEHLAQDLRRTFPEMKGFSRTNLFYMKQIFLAYRGAKKSVQQLVGLIPWGHNIAILSKVDDPEAREFYLRETLAHGWSRNVLVHQIETGLRQRQGGAVTNFARTLPAAQSELAMQTIKDPYIFDFLGLGKEAKEREIQDSLLGHIRDAILELGQGFAFVGSQYHLEIGDEDYYLDLLFYHIRLRCYVVIDLKTGEFIPEHAGKMNFYLSAVDDLLRDPKDEPTIGLILCRDKNRIIAEYALRDMKKPLSIASYNLLRKLPRRLQASLPPVAQLEEELGKEL